VPVGVEWRRVLGVGPGTLVGGPAVIGARCPPVYLFPSLPSYVVDEEEAGGGLYGELEGVAQAQRPAGPIFARGNREVRAPSLMLCRLLGVAKIDSEAL
jgi:hypothetical protein